MPLLLDNAPMPTDPIARAKRPQYGTRPDPDEGRITTPWLEWFTLLFTVISRGPSRLTTVSLPAGTAASIAGTDIAGASLTAGLYRITYYAQITQAATVSSSLTISFAWTYGAVAQSASGAAITGNTTQTWQSSTIMVRIDAGSPIQYSTTYASAGATPMQYGADIVMERMS